MYLGKNVLSFLDVMIVTIVYYFPILPRTRLTVTFFDVVIAEVTEFHWLSFIDLLSGQLSHRHFAIKYKMDSHFTFDADRLSAHWEYLTSYVRTATCCLRIRKQKIQSQEHLTILFSLANRMLILSLDLMKMSGAIHVIIISSQRI